MNMELVRVAQQNWHQVPDCQAIVMRWLDLPVRAQAVRLATSVPSRRLPALDWPADLFADEVQAGLAHA